MGSLGLPWGNAALKLGEIALVTAIAVIGVWLKRTPVKHFS